ncbi:MAG TPA: hypothetical protein VFR56_10310 [Actinomycetes bacterium]|nr:hypothetical protein [Actinomycetes bacterium]
MTFVPAGDPARGAGGPADDPWAALREGLAADVRRVSDRLRSMSATRLASPPGPSADPADQGPAYVSRAQAGRAAAAELARVATALEAQAARPGPADPPPSHPRQVPDLPVLSDLAVGDQVAVTGHDLLAALDAVPPGTPVWTSTDENPTAEQAVRQAARVLADVRRRL